MKMLTEPMTASRSAAVKQDREAWDTLERELRATQAERQRAQEACEQMGKRITALSDELHAIKHEVMGGEDVPGSANRVTVEDVRQEMERLRAIERRARK